eukprot:XP_001709384.1 Hypothetical protein GL50803_36986 [Giardia lamblia ATCC 50803]
MHAISCVKVFLEGCTAKISSKLWISVGNFVHYSLLNGQKDVHFPVYKQSLLVELFFGVGDGKRGVAIS